MVLALLRALVKFAIHTRAISNVGITSSLMILGAPVVCCLRRALTASCTFCGIVLKSSSIEVNWVVLERWRRACTCIARVAWLLCFLRRHEFICEENSR